MQIGFGQLRTVTSDTILYSRRDDALDHGEVALTLSEKAAASLIEWKSINQRLKRASILNLQR